MKNGYMCLVKLYFDIDIYQQFLRLLLLIGIIGTLEVSGADLAIYLNTFFLNKTFEEEHLIIHMQKYNLATIFKNSIVIYPEYFERFLGK